MTDITLSSTGRISYSNNNQSNMIWFANFENADLSEFSNVDVDVGNSLEVIQYDSFNGSYSMYINKGNSSTTAKGVYEFSPNVDKFHFSFAMKVENYSASSWTRFFELRPALGQTKLVYMDYNRIYFIGGKTDVFDIGDGLWHKFDVYVSSDIRSSVFIYLDDIQIAEYFGELDWTDTQGNLYTLGSIEVGILYAGGPCSGDIYFDDFKLEEWTPPELPLVPPEAEFIHYPTVPRANESIIFYAENYSEDVDGNIVEYQWTFPDNTILYGGNVTYAFKNEGKHNIKLNITDNDGFKTTINRDILVYDRQPVSIVGGWNLPLSINGSQILDSNGIDITKLLTGVSKQGIEYTTTWREGNPNYYENDSQLMDLWGINLVRVPFNWYNYMTDYQYREIIQDFVENKTSRGMLVIMDMHHYHFRGWQGQLPQAVDISKETAWMLGRDAILSLKAVAHDFLYNPMVIGVEINEYRPKFPDEDPSYEYLFDFELSAELADEVHELNPNLIIGIELGWGGGGVTSSQYVDIRNQTKQLAVGKNFVYMPHCYFVHNFGRSYVWRMYEDGDFVSGKNEMYRVLDTYYLSEQQFYNFPVIVTEWGGTGYNAAQIVRDEFDYFIAHNWGSTYWAWFRQSISNTGDPIDMGLLQNDWETPSYSGEGFLEKLGEYGFN